MIKKLLLTLSCFSILTLVACGYEGDIPVATELGYTNLAPSNHITIEIISEETYTEMLEPGVWRTDWHHFGLTRSGVEAVETITVAFIINEPIMHLDFDMMPLGLTPFGFGTGDENGFPIGTRFIISEIPLDFVVEFTYSTLQFSQHTYQLTINTNATVEKHLVEVITSTVGCSSCFEIDVISDEDLAELTEFVEINFADVQTNYESGTSNILITFDQEVFNVYLYAIERHSNEYREYQHLDILAELETLGPNLLLVITNFPYSERISGIGFGRLLGRRMFTFIHPEPGVVRFAQDYYFLDKNDDSDVKYDDVEIE